MKENMLRFLIFTLFIPGYFSFTFSANERADWGYGKKDGPNTWSKTFPLCGSGVKQSPIDILTKEAKRKFSLSPVHMWDYDVDVSNVQIINDGHTLRLTPNRTQATFSGGCMHDKKYQLWQMHFHWGNVEDRGSEHQVDGKSFPMEAHLVHYNTKYSPEEAFNKSDGIAVLGFFFEDSKKRNKNYDSIVDAIRALETHPDSNTIKGNLNFKDLIPLDRTFYYCYDGSLTTPGCSEVVTWTLFGRPTFISEEQLEVFRAVKDHHKNRLVDNFRPVQKLNKRVVYVKGGAELISAPFWLISLVAITLISRLT